jgi:O-antigen/teichoic acid export membrane protein
VLTQAIFIAFGAVFMILQLGFIWLIIAALISLLPQIALAVWIIRRDDIPLFPVRIVPRNWPALLRAGVPFGIISLALTIAFSIDTVMLSGQVSEHAVGWYNVAYGLVRSLMFFFAGFSQAMVPSLSRTFVNDARQVESWYRRSVKFIMILSLPLAVGGLLLAFPLISFLYTDEFLPAASALQVLIWDVPLLMFTGFCGNMTTVVSEEKAAARIYSINAAANVLLNLYAIPRFGIIGAAFVTVVTDLIGALQFHMLLRRKLNLPGVASILMRVALAAALMGAIVIALSRQHLHLFVMIGAGAITYLLMILALRLIDSSERAAIAGWLRRFQPSRPAGESSP